MSRNSIVTPRVSIVLPVFNGAIFIGEAIQSILAQTMSDFELIVVDNGSTDDTSVVIQSFKDDRLRLIHESMHGLVPALNTGVQECCSPYIARMDSDDVCAVNRLQRQMEYLDSNAECVLVGSWATIFDHNGRLTGAQLKPPTENHDILSALCGTNVIVHGSVMMRRDAVMTAGMYSTQFKFSEDYDLWLRLGSTGTLANIPEFLYQWRLNPKSTMHSAAPNEKRYFAALAQRNALERYLHNKRVVDGPITQSSVETVDWIRGYLSYGNLAVGNYLVAKALINNVWDKKVWLILRRAYASKDVVTIMSHAMARWIRKLRSHPVR